MAARKGGLGRGLDALIPVHRPDRGFAQLPLDRIVANPRQPREDFDQDALDELAASIRQVGILQPVVVRPESEDGTYALVAGERRWRAAAVAGLEEIPALIRDAADEGTDLTEALVENLQREDLSALEEAAAYQQLMEEFAMTHEDIALRVGKSRSAVTNTLRLLQLPAGVHTLLASGSLSAGAARALLGLDDQAYAVHVAERAATEGWSVRQVEEAVRARQGSREGSARRRRGSLTPRPAAIVALEERLSDRLGSRVAIDYGPSGGKLTVRFSDLDDLERIYKAFFGS